MQVFFGRVVGATLNTHPQPLWATRLSSIPRSHGGIRAGGRGGSVFQAASECVVLPAGGCFPPRMGDLEVFATRLFYEKQNTGKGASGWSLCKVAWAQKRAPKKDVPFQIVVHRTRLLEGPLARSWWERASRQNANKEVGA